jgi:hypothetical protein
MSCAIMVSAYSQACASHRWKIFDRFSIAADGRAFSYFAGRVWAVGGGQEL